jgi:hypothetical protein
MAIMLPAAVGLLRIGHHLQPFKLIRMQINLHGRSGYTWIRYRMLDNSEGRGLGKVHRCQNRQVGLMTRLIK